MTVLPEVGCTLHVGKRQQQCRQPSCVVLLGTAGGVEGTRATGEQDFKLLG